jgi:hypothetical protein
MITKRGFGDGAVAWAGYNVYSSAGAMLGTVDVNGNIVNSSGTIIGVTDMYGNASDMNGNIIGSVGAQTSGGSSFLSTLGYDIQSAWYNLTGIGTPPIVMPVNASTQLQAQAAAIPSVAQMAETAVSQSATQVVNALPAVSSVIGVGVVAVAAYLMYQLLKVKKAVS